MDKVTNDDGYCIYFKYINLQGSAVYLPNEVIYNLPFNRWKKYKLNDFRKIIEYSDSEGNLWDTTFGGDNPFPYKELNKEILDISYEYYKNQRDILNNIRVVTNDWDGLNYEAIYKLNKAYNESYSDINKIIESLDYIFNNNEEIEEDDMPF